MNEFGSQRHKAYQMSNLDEHNELDKSPLNGVLGHLITEASLQASGFTENVLPTADMSHLLTM